MIIDTKHELMGKIKVVIVDGVIISDVFYINTEFSSTFKLMLQHYKHNEYGTHYIDEQGNVAKEILLPKKIELYLQDGSSLIYE